MLEMPFRMKLYNYWRSSASYRVRLALEFKQLTYEYVAISLLQGEQFEAAHRARNPWGSVPVLEIAHDGEKRYIAQSVAILEYLEECFPQRALLPKSSIERALVRSMVELINSSIQPFQNLSTLNYLHDVVRTDNKAWARFWIDKGLTALETQAQKSAGSALVGDAFTLADVCLLAQLFSGRRLTDITAEKYPTLCRVEANYIHAPFVEKAKPEAQPDASL